MFDINRAIYSRMPKKSLLIILAIALLFSGCSVIKLGYNHADWYLRYKINDYTSFNAKQKEDIRKEVDIYMLWHRKNALPEYAAFLQDLYGVVQQDGRLKTENVTRLRGEYSKLYKKTMAPAVRPAAHLLNSIDSRQIEKLRKTLADKNRKQKEETLYGSEQKNIVMRAERNIDMAEKLTGKPRTKRKSKETEPGHTICQQIFYRESRSQPSRIISTAKQQSRRGKNCRISDVVDQYSRSCQNTATTACNSIIRKRDG